MVSSKKISTAAATDRNAMFPIAPGAVEMPADYADWLTDIKTRIHSERLCVVLDSNAAMVLLPC